MLYMSMVSLLVVASRSFGPARCLMGGCDLWPSPYQLELGRTFSLSRRGKNGDWPRVCFMNRRAAIGHQSLGSCESVTPTRKRAAVISVVLCSGPTSNTP